MVAAMDKVGVDGAIFNPTNDSEAMSAILKKAGFDVVEAVLCGRAVSSSGRAVWPRVCPSWNAH
jgi:hypothetical protein